MSERNHTLEGLLNLRSVALVGASERNFSSATSIKQLRSVGFDGSPLGEPSEGLVLGQETMPDCKSIGEPVDAALLCVPQDEVLGAARDAIEAGIRYLVVVIGGFAEVGGDGVELEAELHELPASAGVSVLGPSCSRRGASSVYADPSIRALPEADRRTDSVVVRRYDWNQTYSAADYRKLMLSYSGTQMMEERNRRGLPISSPLVGITSAASL